MAVGALPLLTEIGVSPQNISLFHFGYEGRCIFMPEYLLAVAFLTTAKKKI